MATFTEDTRAARLNDGKFKWETCCNCGIEFAMPERFHDMRRADHELFYCPFGHPQHYIVGKTRVELAQEKAARAEREAANIAESLRIERASHTATKGQLTKAKKRAANGVCPCCNRSFVNVANHVANKHPEHLTQLKETSK